LSLWVTIVCVGLHLGSGCIHDTGPEARLGRALRVIEHQEKIVAELRQLGAECDACFEKAPYIRIQLDKKWRGGGDTVSLLRELDHVDELTLVGSRIDDALLRQIVSLPGLEVVRLQHTAITPAALVELRRAKALLGLEMRQPGFPSSVWDDICTLNLAWLHMETDAPSLSENTPKPDQMPRLFSLRLSGPRITDYTLRRIGRLRQLRALVLANTRVTDAGLGRLAELARLSYLDLSMTRVRGHELKTLCNLKHLRELALTKTLVADSEIPQLTRFQCLESVTLDGTGVTDQGVASLANLKNLRTVSIVGTPTTLACLNSLSKIKTLITVVDSEGDITVFRSGWLKHRSGQGLPYWAKCHSKKLFIWMKTGRQPYDDPQ